MLAFEGRVYRDGKFWLAEIPELGLMTQGKSRADAYRMARSVVIDAIGKPGLDVQLSKGDRDTFLVSSEDSRALIALMLKKQRQLAQLTVRQAAERLHSKYPNAYGVYEQGRADPTLGKLEELLSAVDPKRKLILKWTA